MAVITLGGVDYPAPATHVQIDPEATEFEPNKVPTGATIESVLNSNFVKKAWTKKPISLANSALSTTNSLTVGELQNATEIVVCASNQQVKHHFIRVDDNIDTFVLNFDMNNAAWRLAFNLSVNWSTKAISTVTYYKGGNQPYPVFDAVYYR